MSIGCCSTRFRSSRWPSGVMSVICMPSACRSISAAAVASASQHGTFGFGRFLRTVISLRSNLGFIGFSLMDNNSYSGSTARREA